MTIQKCRHKSLPTSSVRCEAPHWIAVQCPPIEWAEGPFDLGLVRSTELESRTISAGRISQRPIRFTGVASDAVGVSCERRRRRPVRFMTGAKHRFASVSEPVYALAASVSEPVYALAASVSEPVYALAASVSEPVYPAVVCLEAAAFIFEYCPSAFTYSSLFLVFPLKN